VRRCCHTEVARSGQLYSLGANFLINAVGRSGLRSEALHRVRRFVDRLIGDVRVLASDAEPYTMVESAPHDWWYSAPLPDKRLVVAYMTDADLRTGA
jgi:hypothetical protein